jgi:hypothetical protein
MNTENEYEDIRELLGHGTQKTAPAGLDRKIMDGIVAFENKRRRGRMALASWIRFIAVGLLLILLGRIFGPQMSGNVAGKLTVTDVANWAEKTGDAGMWLVEHAYYFLPFILLLVFRNRLGGRTRA